MTSAVPYYVPREPGSWRAVVLALAVHAALFAFLWFGVRWQNEVPVAIEAEVWDITPREAAPAPPPPQPAPKPIAPTPPKVIEPPIAKPDIALEREKKQKELEKQREEEKQQALKQEEEKQAKIEAEKKRKEQEAKEQKRLDNIRKESLNRMMTQAGSGDAPKTQGRHGSPEYGAKIRAKIRSNTAFVIPPNLAGNPAVEYSIELLPDGSLRRIKLLKPSGISGFDEAVRNGIEKSQPYPADKSGKVPSEVIVIEYRPIDQ